MSISQEGGTAGALTRLTYIILVYRTSADIDPSLQKTQCSVYNVANKQQPSIVNIQNRTEKIQLGHDVMMAEKEKFLGELHALIDPIELTSA